MQQVLAERILYKLRGYFRADRPMGPEDLTLGQDTAEGVIHHCIDSRMLTPFVLHMTEGEYFDSAGAAAAIPPWREGLGADLQMAVNLGFPLLNFSHANTIIIKGHTYCGAVMALYQLLRTRAGGGSQAARWMLAAMPEGLSEILAGADTEHAPPILRMMEQVIVLQSVLNLHDYIFDAKPMRAMIEQEGACLIGCIRGLDKLPNGRYPLAVFDPAKGEFRDIHEIYKDAGSPDLKRMEAAGSWTRYAQEAGLAIEPGSFVIEKDVRRGIDTLIRKLRAEAQAA